ncbi:MAG: helix-turn-helix domain-containing protein [Candidatus Sericytochromatia bacterium]|nr:helix-turn-helix domain-containing protein [Candidatus Sericytochromatia bacterium]
MTSRGNKRSVTKSESRLLASIHDTARDLHDAGFIDKRRMRHYEALCLQPVEPYTREQIVALRARFSISQAVLASLLNTSLSTVRQWEAGLKRPSGPSLKLLNLLGSKGIEALV